MNLIKLPRLRQRDIALIVMGLSIAGAALWWYLMYQPAQERIAELDAEIVRLDREIERGEAARRNLPELRLAVDEAEQERLAFLAELPTENQVAQLLDELRLSAESAGVLFNAVSQAGNPERPVDGVRSLGFSVTTRGVYSETMDFLASLETLQRFAKIQQVGLSLQADDSSNPDLSANYAFTVYVFTGHDPGGDR